MNKKFFVIIVAVMIFVGLVSSVFAEDTSIWASPHSVTMLKLPNGYTEMYEGRIELYNGTVEDGEYYSIVYWTAPYAGSIWGKTAIDDWSYIVVELQRWTELTNHQITFGEVYKGSTWDMIFNKIVYHRMGAMTAYIKVRVENNCITRIWTDDDDWNRHGKEIGWW